MNLAEHVHNVRTYGLKYEMLYDIKQLTGAGADSHIAGALERIESHTYARLPHDEIKRELCYEYKKIFGYEPDPDIPETYNEKILWSKLNDRDPLRTLLTDKASVRDWVIEKLGTDKYCVPRYGVWDSFDEIDFGALPDSFILKVNHGWDANALVKDKRDLDVEECRKKFDKWMRKSFLGRTMEYQYLGIVPKIICEELLFSDKDDLPDYKFFCFDGKVFCSYLMEDYSLDPQNGKLGFLDRDFNLMPYHRKEYRPLDAQPQKPEGHEKMIEIAEILSEGFPHVRVDLYNVNGKIYFGEMTFTTTAGYGKFDPPEFDRVLGEQWKINTTYVIRENTGYDGFCATLIYVMYFLMFAQEHGFAPVIKLTREFAYFDEEKSKEISNPWEYYFATPDDVCDESNAKNVCYCNYHHRDMMREKLPLSPYDAKNYDSDRVLEACLPLVRKYLKLKPEIIDDASEILKQVWNNGGKVLGVHFRGTDYKKGYDRHPVFVDEEETIAQIRKAMENVKFDAVFVATDDLNVFDRIKTALPNTIVLMHPDVYRSGGDVSVAFSKDDRKFHHYLLGYEIARDMYTLSLCDGLVAGKSSVGFMSNLYKRSRNEEYEYMHIIDNGNNENDNAYFKES